MNRFKNILCVVETGETCKPALERAVTLAEKNQARLTVVEIAEHAATGGELREGPAAAEVQRAQVNARGQGLDLLVEPYRTRIEIQTSVLKGTPFLEIIREVLRHGRDLVIKTPEAREWLDRLFGSTDMHLLRKCPCPVWLVKPSPAKAYRRILAAVDVDAAYPPAERQSRHALNLQILEMATSLALSDQAKLHIVSTWDALGEGTMRSAFMHMPEETILAYGERVMRQHAANLAALIGEVVGHLEQEATGRFKPNTHLVQGWARKEIPALSKRIEADLVVMGTVCRTGIPGFIVGNTAETILNQIACSVLAIKPPGFATPVTVTG